MPAGDGATVTMEPECEWCGAQLGSITVQVDRLVSFACPECAEEHGDSVPDVWTLMPIEKADEA